MATSNTARGHPISTEVASQSLTTFIFFHKLPTEIQIRILEYAFLDEYFIRILSTDPHRAGYAT
jgi:hypothetical protein